MIQGTAHSYAMQSDGWGGDTFSDNTHNGTCSGPITVIFKWHGTGTKPDAIVVAGGVSVGPYDVVKLAFEAYRSWRGKQNPPPPATALTSNG